MRWKINCIKKNKSYLSNSSAKGRMPSTTSSPLLSMKMAAHLWGLGCFILSFHSSKLSTSHGLGFTNFKASSNLRPVPDSISNATSLAPQSNTLPAKRPSANCSWRFSWGKMMSSLVGCINRIFKGDNCIWFHDVRSILKCDELASRTSKVLNFVLLPSSLCIETKSWQTNQFLSCSNNFPKNSQRFPKEFLKNS